MKTWTVTLAVTTGSDQDANQVLARAQNAALSEFATVPQSRVELKGRYIVRDRRLVRTRRSA